MRYGCRPFSAPKSEFCPRFFPQSLWSAKRTLRDSSGGVLGYCPTFKMRAGGASLRPFGLWRSSGNLPHVGPVKGYDWSDLPRRHLTERCVSRTDDEGKMMLAKTVGASRFRTHIVLLSVILPILPLRKWLIHRRQRSSSAVRVFSSKTPNASRRDFVDCQDVRQSNARKADVRDAAFEKGKSIKRSIISGCFLVLLTAPVAAERPAEQWAPRRRRW